MSDVKVTTYEGPSIEAALLGTAITVSVGSLSAGGGSGAVDSVNDQVGVVVLDAADVGADPTGTAASAVAGEAIARAAGDATSVSTAAADATTKANAAQSAATSAAATDATSKVATETSRAATAEALLAPKASPTFTGTVAGISKSMVGLGSVDNTADASKPVSTLQAAADATVLASAATDATTKANAAQTAAATDATTKVATETTRATTAEALLAPKASPTFTGTVSGVTATHVGLGNVDNTSDVNKPVSTAQATADALKLAKASNLSDLANAGTARTNLGLGTAATVNTGTSSGDIPLLSTGGVLPIARLATGTPTGAKFIRDDGTLQTPAGGGAVGTDTIFDAKGDLPVGTGADTAAKLPAGSNGKILLTDSTQTTGLSWVNRVGPIAYCQYAPAIGTAKSTTSGTSADVDATNLVVTFTAPPSGTVMVTFSAYSTVAAANNQMQWGLRSGSSDVTGSYLEAMSSFAGSSAIPTFITANIVMSGLTAGTSYTWKWAFRRAGAGSSTCYIFAGLEANGGTGPATMLVTALP